MDEGPLRIKAVVARAFSSRGRVRSLYPRGCAVAVNSGVAAVCRKGTHRCVSQREASAKCRLAGKRVFKVAAFHGDRAVSRSLGFCQWPKTIRNSQAEL